jgi:hypothetical protein
MPDGDSFLEKSGHGLARFKPTIFVNTVPFSAVLDNKIYKINVDISCFET